MSDELVRASTSKAEEALRREFSPPQGHATPKVETTHFPFRLQESTTLGEVETEVAKNQACVRRVCRREDMVVQSTYVECLDLEDHVYLWITVTIAPRLC